MSMPASWLRRPTLLVLEGASGITTRRNREEYSHAADLMVTHTELQGRRLMEDWQSTGKAESQGRLVGLTVMSPGFHL